MTRTLTQQPLTTRGLCKLAGITLCGVLSCMAVALIYNAALFRNADPEAFRLAMICAVVVPTILGGPLFVFLSLKLRELRVLNRRLEIVAAHDGLTTLLNRRAFTERVEARLESMATDGLAGALFLIDADFFKSINDRYGHATGDRALKAIALRLQDSVREGDIIGRLGGEEFAVLMIGADETTAMAVADRIRRSVCDMPFQIAGELLTVTVSEGLAVFDAARDNAATLIERADQALYEAKRDGRNRVGLAKAA